MADKSKIEWTEATWNPIRARNLQTGGVGHFCVHQSPGCMNCYSEGFQRRFKNPVRFAAQDRAKVAIYLDEKALLQPLRWRRPRMIFVCSMTDLFGDFVTDEMIDRVFAVMALCPQHTFQVLTKRSARMREYLEGWRTVGGEQARKAAIVSQKAEMLGRSQNNIGEWPLPNVWLGVSAEDQQRADERIPDLLATPAAVRWISAEPLLGPVDLVHLTVPPGKMNALLGIHRGTFAQELPHPPAIDWVVCGGESGPGARPMHPDWARSLRDQCAAAGVPFFFKQWGAWVPVCGAVDAWDIADDPEISRFDHRDWEDENWGNPYRPMWCDETEDDTVFRVGKKRAGRLLDGVTHDAMPQVRL